MRQGSAPMGAAPAAACRRASNAPQQPRAGAAPVAARRRARTAPHQRRTAPPPPALLLL